jgi:TIR domain
MPSLIDIPELVGFFSYSRDDDQGSRGALSALRDAIQTELSAQLGRTRTDFRLWQDKSAISLGTLWEKQISQGINQSVFFIPIITPRAVRSQHCAYEFQAFLARETELGRDDLVFPILYIPVSALEDEKLWRDEPILRIVATRQYLDWRELRHHDPRSIEVQQKLEWYCRGITNALHKTWIPPISPNPLKRDELEAAETNLHLGADAPRHAEQDELARKGDTPQPAAEERSREHAAERRAWPALAAVKPGVGVVVAAALALILIGGSVTAWLALGPSANTKSTIAATAPTPTLPPLANVGTVAVPTKMSSATSTNTPSQPLAPAASAPVPPIVSGPAADEVAWALIQDTDDAAALRRFVAQFPDSARRKDAEAHLASLLAAQTAWNLVKDSKDPDPLRQFVRQFPDSVQRNDAEARLDLLLAAQAAWHSVRDSKDPDKLRQFVLQFPDSSERSVAEQMIVSLEAIPQKPTVTPSPDPHELTRSLQLELQRVGCFKGTVNGQFDEDTKTAWHRFMKLVSITMSDDVSTGTIDAVRGITKRICPLDCPRGQHAEKETCVANAPPEHDAKPRRSTEAPPEHDAKPRRSTEAPPEHDAKPRRSTEAPPEPDAKPRRSAKAPSANRTGPLMDRATAPPPNSAPLSIPIPLIGGFLGIGR